MSYSYQLTKANEILRSDGFVIKIVPNEITPELKEYWVWQNEQAQVAAIQQWMDGKARSMEFAGGIDSVTSFINDSNKTYSDQAKKMLEWRTAVWAKFEKVRGEDLTTEQVMRRLPEAPAL